MNVHSVGYLFKEGVKSLWKNRMMSVASIAVLVSCLLLTGLAGLLSINLSVMMKSVEGNNSISVYLQDDLPRLKSIQVGEELRKIANIVDTKFVPKEEGLKQVMEQLNEDGSLLSGLDGEENILPDVYTVTMKELGIYQETWDQIHAIEGVDSITNYSDIASKLSNLDRVVKYASIGVVLVLGIVSLFIISNTIKVTMFSRRMEITIMKSVGATNGFVRVPFIVEGIVIGVLSGVTAATVLYFAYEKVVDVIFTIIPFLSSVDIKPYTWFLYIAYIIAGMLFGLVAGGISIGKYLRKEGENANV